MGKIILAGVLVLALAPATLVGLPGNKGAKLAREAARLESRFEGELGNLYESYGTSCLYSLSGEEYNDFMRAIDKLNNRRQRDFRRKGMSAPGYFSYCGGEGYGYGPS